MRFPEREDSHFLVIPFSKGGRILSEAGRRVDWILNFKLSKDLGGEYDAVLFSFEQGVRCMRILCILDEGDFEEKVARTVSGFGLSGMKISVLKNLSDDALDALQSKLPGAKIIAFR